MPSFEVHKDKFVFVCDCKRKHTIQDEGENFTILTDESNVENKPPEEPEVEETMFDRVTKRRK
jgi:hypothetical protein